ncbi:MAG: 23S rRNA (pseudouridine(1915)-N(3))-methyltransferase RlmH [Bacteroidia bacterium]|nr:MAG: 23S rRNA (pseudouridine(1915)-N(3))-methyltransferase RlmH [Bacteroidia bacterium]
MKVTILFTGKTDTDFIKEGVDHYAKRIKRYTDLRIITAAVPAKWRSLPEELRKEREGSMILKQMEQHDRCILLDEKGKNLSSVEFASYIEKATNQAVKRMLFVIGGPWGFAPEVYAAAHHKLSLSPMTFSHQVIRILFMEQLYRAFTILRGEPYHNA